MFGLSDELCLKIRLYDERVAADYLVDYNDDDNLLTDSEIN